LSSVHQSFEALLLKSQWVSMRKNKKPFVVTLPEPPTPEEPDESFEPVLAPHDHDVLCGRGGLTNHHLGNAWYRQLVRSNRELYKKSQKHTKLLIAKAIVNHVQEQDPPGRFLEADKKSGLWMPVSFKKAVDKTSQALREKDRENEGAIDTKVLMNVEEFAEEEEKTEQACVEDEKEEKLDDVTPIDLNSSTSWLWRKTKKAKVEMLVEPDDLGDPLPLPAEPITKRASSMFRFFSQSKLMDDNISAKLMTDELLNDSQNSILGKDQALLCQNQIVQPSQPPEFQPLIEPQSIQEITNVSMNPSRVTKVPMKTGNEPSQAMIGFPKDIHSIQFRPGSTRAGEVIDVDAPILTRLKSQVSDWLQSFFPVSEDIQNHHQLQNTSTATQGEGQSNSTAENRSQFEQRLHQHRKLILDQLGHQNHHIIQQESGQVTQSQLQQSPMKTPLYQHMMMMNQSIFNLENQIVSNQNGKSILTLRQLQQQMQELSRYLINQRMDTPSQHPIGLSSVLRDAPPSRSCMVQSDLFSRGGPGKYEFEFQSRGSVMDSSRTEQNHSSLLMPPPSNVFGSVYEGVGTRDSPSSHALDVGTYEPAFGLRPSGSLLMEDED
jgi:hypothetical protein